MPPADDVTDASKDGSRGGNLGGATGILAAIAVLLLACTLIRLERDDLLKDDPDSINDASFSAPLALLDISSGPLALVPALIPDVIDESRVATLCERELYDVNVLELLSTLPAFN